MTLYLFLFFLKNIFVRDKSECGQVKISLVFFDPFFCEWNGVKNSVRGGDDENSPKAEDSISGALSKNTQTPYTWCAPTHQNHRKL